MDWIKNNKVLILIVLLAAIFRFSKITEIPYGFDGDEAAFGYYGYSLLKNGTDEYGNFLPLYFPSIGDYKYPVYAYATVLPTAIFGPGIFSARFVSAISGVLLTFVVYKLIFELTKNKYLSLLASLVLAVSPFSIVFSRGAYESNLSLLLITSATYFLVKKKIKFKLFLLFLVLSIFTYSAARVFWLLFLPTYFAINCKISDRKNIRKLFVYLVIAVSIIIFSFLDPRSRVRALNIGFFDEAYSGNIQEEYIFEDGLVMTNVNTTRFFHNKYATFVLSFIERYFSHIDPTYLFLKSNPAMDKYSVRGHGLMYIFEIVTIFVSFAVFKKYKKTHIIFLIWLIFSFAPSSLTIETPNPIRSLIAIPPLVYFSSVGLYELLNFNKKYKYLLQFLFVLVISISAGYFWHQYTVHDLYYRPWTTDGGLVEAVKSAEKIDKEYNFKKIVFPDDPYIFVLLFSNITPDRFLKTADIETEALGKWERVNGFDKYIFKMNVGCPKIGKKDVLYVCKGDQVPINAKLHDAIRFKDGLPAYVLIEFVPYSERPVDELPDRVHQMVETDLSFEEALLPENENRYW